MDNRAQVSLEYMLIISVLITIAALVSLFAANMFGVKDTILETNLGLKKNLDSMWFIEKR